MFRRLVAGLILTIVLLTAVSYVLVAPGEERASGGTLGVTQTDQFDSTVFRVHLFENGSARWTVQQARVLETDDDEAQFREFAERFRTNSTEVYENFQIRAQTLTESGTETTGRAMTATQFGRDAYVDPLGQTRGILEMSFVWSNFTRVEGERIVLADVFGGGWGIIENQRLTIQRGDGLVFEEAVPSPDSMTVAGDLAASKSMTWFGERRFADERPRVVLVPDTQPGENGETPTPTENGSSPGDGTPDDPTQTIVGDDSMDGGSSLGLVPIVLVLLVLGLAGGVAWYSGLLSRIGGGSTTAGQSTTTPDTAGAESQIPDEELLADEDRVIQLLEQNGGRMKQVDIVEQTEWSKSKVSMLLSEMESEEQISKLRVGRENIISLSGEEPDAAGSPFEDE